VTGAVLDACVLFQAPLRDTLLRAADAGLYLPFWSLEILEEVHRNLVRDAKLAPAQATRLVDTMQAAFPEALVTELAATAATMRNHPKDRHVLAAAVVAEAGVIVTHNVKDFPAAALEGTGVAVQTPDDFLMELFADHARSLLLVTQNQAAQLRSPVSDSIPSSVPRKPFAVRVRRRLEVGHDRCTRTGGTTAAQEVIREVCSRSSGSAGSQWPELAKVLQAAWAPLRPDDLPSSEGRWTGAGGCSRRVVVSACGD
jgi:predicted nucleic acid-binding protein